MRYGYINKTFACSNYNTWFNALDILDLVMENRGELDFEIIDSKMGNFKLSIKEEDLKEVFGLIFHYLGLYEMVRETRVKKDYVSEIKKLDGRKYPDNDNYMLKVNAGEMQLRLYENVMKRRDV